MTRLLAAGAVVLASLLGTAKPAAADPAKPTDYRSEILSVHPTLPKGVTVSVVGGDAFLELQVDRGHRVVVQDYQQAEGTTPPAYLRVRADGTVEVNDRSIAASINESRYGSNSSSARPDEAPRWKVVGRDGRYTWHDHRIHWMSPRAPTAVAPDHRVDMGGTGGTWTVDLRVDGTPVTVRGQLLLLPSPSPVPWLAAVILSGGLVLALAARAVRSRSVPPHGGYAVALAAVAALATLVGTVQWRTIPAGAGGNPLTAAVPAVAMAAALVAAFVDRSTVRLAGLAAAAATLAGWGLLRREALFRAVLPTELPYAVDRLGTALALGVGVGVAAVLVWRPPARPRPSAASRPSPASA
ncbi:hypothetical protein BH10ACT1_BH10ACT1_23780 [soil metagenome]